MHCYGRRGNISVNKSRDKASRTLLQIIQKEAADELNFSLLSTAALDTRDLHKAKVTPFLTGSSFVEGRWQAYGLSVVCTARQQLSPRCEGAATCTVFQSLGRFVCDLGRGAYTRVTFRPPQPRSRIHSDNPTLSSEHCIVRWFQPSPYVRD